VKLSVVIPAYNEEGSIAQTVTAIAQRLDAESIEREIIVVDDGSTDSTGEIMQRLQSEDATTALMGLASRCDSG